MSRREDIDNSIWDDPEFASLSAPSKLVYLWSFTNPRCNMAGLYKVPVRHISGETGLTENRVERALVELQAAMFVYYDGGVLWVRARVKHLRTRNRLMAKSVLTSVEKFDGHPFADLFRDVYGDCAWLHRANGGEPHE